MARTATDAPSRRGDTANLMLFSTSVCSDSRGTMTAAVAGRHVQREAQAIAESHPFDLQVVADRAQLVFDRHERLLIERRPHAGTASWPVMRSAPAGSS